MKPLLRTLLSIILCVLIAAGCYFWVMGLIDSNYSYRSPLQDNPPAAGEALGAPSTGRVVIVLIDALRYDTSLDAAIMPNLNQLRSEGASALIHSEPPSYSEPGYSTILTGAWPWLNDGPVFNLDYEDIPTFTQDDIFSAAHRAGLKTAISGYYWFEKLVPQSAVDYSFYTPGEDNAADEEVMAAALPWLENGDARLVLIHLDQVDYAGHHEGGPLSTGWDEAARRTDAMLGQIVATLDLSQDTILVFSDHGQIDAGGHGGYEQVTLQEPFVAAGAAVKPGQYSDMYQVDIAPTVAALLGTNLPASTQGEVRSDMFELTPSVLESLPEAVETQQTTLLTAFASAIGAELDASDVPTGSNVEDYQQVMNELRTARVNNERLPRALIAVIFLAAVIFWLVKNIHRGAIAWIIGGLAFAALFNYRYAGWDGKTYSLSSVTGEMDLIVYVAVTSLLAALTAWLLIFFSRRYFRQTPSEAARLTFGLVFTTAFINGLPAVVSFVVNGPVLTWTLPDYLTSFLAMLSLAEVVFISIFGLLFAGLAALVSRLVKQNPLRKAHRA